MHRATRLGIAAFAFIIAAAAMAMAADSPVTLRVTLKNGRTWKGTLVEAHDRWLILEVDGREVYCYRSAIVQTEQHSGGSYQPVPVDGNPTLLQTKRRRKSDMYLYVNFCSGGFNICSMSDKSELGELGKLDARIGPFFVVENTCTHLGNAIWLHTFVIHDPRDGKDVLKISYRRKNLISAEREVMYPVYNKVLEWAKESRRLFM